jgi:death on curing protein
VIEPAWIDERDAIALHDRLLALHGGGQGTRDLGLLQAALARPRQMLAYASDSDVITLSAACTFGIVKNHPFIDDNKPTGFVVGVLFLESNGFRFTATEADAARAILSLADRTLTEESFIRFLRENTSVADPHGRKQDHN